MESSVFVPISMEREWAAEDTCDRGVTQCTFCQTGGV